MCITSWDRAKSTSLDRGKRGLDEEKLLTKRKGTGKLFDEINAEDKTFSTSLLLFVLVKK